MTSLIFCLHGGILNCVPGFPFEAKPAVELVADAKGIVEIQRH